jgi:uncharacterized protein
MLTDFLGQRAHVRDVRATVLTIAAKSPIPLSLCPAMRFECDEHKNRQNLRKHNVRFEAAVLVFDDPCAITQRDYSSDDEERWTTLGAIGPGSILLVIHMFCERETEEIIRIILARAAESHERKAYEETHKGAEARHPRDRRKKRRRH